MSKGEITSLAYKILAIFLMIQGINAIASVLTYYIASPNKGVEQASNIIAPFIFFILFGISLWLLSDKLSRIMAKDENYSELTEALRITVSDIQRISFSVIGLFFIGNAIPQLVSVLANLYSIYRQDVSVSLLPNIVGSVTKLILGLMIFLGSQGLVNILKAIRKAGVKEYHE